MMKSTLRLAIFAVAALSAAWQPSAQAGLVFSNFGPGDTYDGTAGLSITGTGSGATPFTQGAEFTAGSSGLLSEIDVAFSNTGVPQQFNLGLYSADGSGQLGTLLESFNGITAPTFFPGSILAVTSTLHPLLNAGTSYFLVASPTDPSGNIAWDFNSTGARGTIYRNQDGTVTYPTDILPAFRVLASAVPEPSSLVLCGIAGMTGLAYAGRHRGRAAV